MAELHRDYGNAVSVSVGLANVVAVQLGARIAAAEADHASSHQITSQPRTRAQ
jgi:hypothetical protein